VDILEIVAVRNEALQAVFAAQRPHLEVNGNRLVVMEMSQLGTKGREKCFQTLEKSSHTPDAILLRGIEDAHLVHLYLPKVPLFIDHCTPFELGSTSPLKTAVMLARRVYCYSQKVDDELRRTGTGKITAISGPTATFDTEHPKNEVPIIAVLDTSSNALSILSRVVKVRKLQPWKFKIASPLRHRQVDLPVEMNLEAVEMADFVIAPSEDKDFGQPHEGAIMAMAFCRPLTTSRTEAFNIMSFPAKNYISARKYEHGTYAAAVGQYLLHREKYDEWTAREKNGSELPDDLLSRM